MTPRAPLLLALALTLALALALALAPTTPANADPYGQGTWEYVTFEKGTFDKPLLQFSPYHITVYAPISCASQCGEFVTTGFPVMVFATGFAAQIEQDKYSEFLIGTARQGIVVVVIDQKVSALKVTQNYVNLAVSLNPVISYIVDGSATGLAADIRAYSSSVKLYMPNNKIFFGGHSSGNHITLEYIKQLGLNSQTCNNVGGVVMISPLDGQDPLGFGGQFVVQSGEYFGFVTPALQVVNELDPVAGSVEGAACVPANRGDAHFYDAWNKANIYYIKALGVGHLDILDDTATTRYDSFCAASNASLATLRSTYRTLVKGSVVNFIAGIAKNDASYLSKITSASLLPTKNVQLKNKGSTRVLGCVWSPVSAGIAWETQLGLVLFGVCYAVVFMAGLYIFFRRMDDDTLGRYVAANEPLGMDKPRSFQAEFQPGMGVGGPSVSVQGSLGPSASQVYQAAPTPSAAYSVASRTPSVQV